MAKAGLKALVLETPSVGQHRTNTRFGGIRQPTPIRQKFTCVIAAWSFLSLAGPKGDDLEWHQGVYSYVAYNSEHETTLKVLNPGSKITV